VLTECYYRANGVRHACGLHGSGWSHGRQALRQPPAVTSTQGMQQHCWLCGSCFVCPVWCCSDVCDLILLLVTAAGSHNPWSTILKVLLYLVQSFVTLSRECSYTLCFPAVCHCLVSPAPACCSTSAQRVSTWMSYAQSPAIA
jgi:hypothetical protein